MKCIINDHFATESKTMPIQSLKISKKLTFKLI